MFAMTSMGVHAINSINDGRGPYVFKISGQLCHRIGSLMPSGGKRPEYCQLDIFDTENEVRNRMAVSSHQNGTFRPNEAIVASLLTMFDTLSGYSGLQINVVMSIVLLLQLRLLAW